MSGLALLAAAVAIALMSGKRSANVAPKAPGKIKVAIGPAKIKPPTKRKIAVTIGPAKIKPIPVRAKVPSSVHDTTAVAVNAARPATGAPIPNPDAARKVAQPVADHYRNNRKKYDHGRVSTFQAFAGLKPDGIYGPKTAKALRQYGAKNVVG